jgi:predicted phosphoribosyltransferase
MQARTDLETGDAGRDLADKLSSLALDDTVIVAMSPRSVSFAFQVAQRLGCELDLLLVGRISAPGHPEQAIGSVLDLHVPKVVVDEKLARDCHLPPGYLDTERHHQLAELERLHLMYLGEDEGSRHNHAGKDVVVLDDGADEAVMQLVIEAFRRIGAHSVRIVEAHANVHDDPVDDRTVTRLIKEARRIHSLLH